MTVLQERERKEIPEIPFGNKRSVVGSADPLVNRASYLIVHRILIKIFQCSYTQK
jgi:hypothetical protein